MESAPVQPQEGPTFTSERQVRTSGQITDLTREAHEYPVARRAFASPQSSSHRAEALDLAVRTSQVSSVVLEQVGYGPTIPAPLYREARAEDKQIQVETGLIPRITLPGDSKAKKTLHERMNALNVPGVSLAVVDEGRVVWSRGYGDLDESTHPGTLTQAASLTKVVTALTVLSLIDQCRQAKASGVPPPGLRRSIDLNTDVGEILDPTLWRQINPAGHKVTIAQLLSHTAGIPAGGSEYLSVEKIDHQFLQDTQQLDKRFQLSTKKEFERIQAELAELATLQKERVEHPTQEIDLLIDKKQKDVLAALHDLSSTLPKTDVTAYNEAIARLSQSQQCRMTAAATPIPTIDEMLEGHDEQLGVVQVRDVPGEKWEYSNPGYTILQKVIETVTGKDFASVVQETVLDPLGMEHTTYSPQVGQTVQGNGSDGRPLPESWRIIPHRAAGGLWTTASDFAQVILAIQGAAHNQALPGKERPIISQELARAMMSGQPGAPGWGLGLGIDREAGYYAHDGSVVGFRNQLISDMRGRGVVILTNSTSGDDLYPEIVKSVAEAYDWPDRGALGICKPKVPPEELYHSLQEATSAEANAVWAKRSGTYAYQDREKRYIVELHRDDEHSGKMVLYTYPEGSSQKASLLLIPLGPSIAYHPPDAEGWSDLVRFGEEEGKAYVEIYGARHFRT